MIQETPIVSSAPQSGCFSAFLCGSVVFGQTGRGGGDAAGRAGSSWGLSLATCTSLLLGVCFSKRCRWPVHTGSCQLRSVGPEATSQVCAPDFPGKCHQAHSLAPGASAARPLKRASAICYFLSGTFWLQEGSKAYDSFIPRSGSRSGQRLRPPRPDSVPWNPAVYWCPPQHVLCGPRPHSRTWSAWCCPRRLPRPSPVGLLFPPGLPVQRAGSHSAEDPTPLQDARRPQEGRGGGLANESAGQLSSATDRPGRFNPIGT